MPSLPLGLLVVLVLQLASPAQRGLDAAPATSAANSATVILEAEAFDDLGGWVLDQQFMDLMGSPFLLAHGMGQPVADAVTTVDFGAGGARRVWVRTRDWVAPWKAPGAPGRFQVLLNDRPLATTFGTTGAAWHWQDGGVVEVSGRTRIALHDLTGFEGRCDAIVFAPIDASAPPEDLATLGPWRRELRGLPEEPRDGGTFDLVVVGGGVAGTAAAVTAARLGLTVALVQDRPVLGGNASSEVRVWPEGHVNQEPWPRVGDVVMEIVPEKRSDSANGQRAAVFDDDRKLRVVRAEKNATLFLERRMNAATAEDGRVTAIVAEHVRTGDRVRLRGRWFADCTGDASLGFLVGADFEQTDRGHMGASNLWNIQCLCEDEDPLSSELAAATEAATFPRCPWAVDLTDRPFPGRTRGSKEPEAGANPITLGNWFWENGFDRDPIHDMERIRDQNFRAMYGAWDAIKNVEKRYPAHRLNWVAYIAGKRESRRLMGDVVLTGEDLRDGKQWNDGAFPCTWGIDTHHPDPRYAKGHEGDEFIADYTRGKGYEYDGPYWVPYRCLYSRNVRNLFMAGRDISVTHEALGAVRVMKTTGAMGEIVGMAAAVCAEQGCDPREVYTRHLNRLQDRMREGAGRLPRVIADAEGSFLLSGRQAALRGKRLQYEASRDAIGWWRTPGDHADWEIELSEPGRFRILVELSCPEEDAGGPFELKAGKTPIAATVRATGGWERFVSQELGTIDLGAGVQRLSIINRKADGPLFKLRAIRLVRARSMK